MKINFQKNTLAMHIVCMAIGENTKLTEQFNYSNNGDHDIVFTVDGVELDFSNVIKSIDDMFEQVVKEQAGKMYLEKFNDTSEKINDELQLIREKLEDIRCCTFPDINWDNV